MVRFVLDVTRGDLAAHTTLRLGGPAGRLVVASFPDEVLQIVRDSPEPERTLILAGGSNVVIADEGVPGTVVLLRTRGIRVEPDGVMLAGSAGVAGIATSAGSAGVSGRAMLAGSGNEVLLTVQAGHDWDEVVAMAVAEGLAGIECLSGVPGSAGATPIQNVGAYGQEVAETIAAVRVVDRRTGAERVLAPAECGFAYRTSHFRHSDRYLVLAATFRLRRTPLSGPVRYAELARALGVEPGARAPLAEVRAAVLALRAGKGMVLSPEDPDTYSVGSFFVNPVLDAPAYAALRARAEREIGTGPASWPGADGSVKVSAAWLIERAGFGKGYHHGGHPGVAVSGKHTLALTNRGTGTTAALLGLAREIRDGVAKRFGVELRPEPVLVGCSL
jgi:UDP-N-acetylmuramate dehydrogenase